MSGRLRKGSWVVLLALVAGGIGAAVALSVPSQSGPMVYACVNSVTGAPAAIAEGQAPTCPEGSKIISWNQVAAQPLSSRVQQDLASQSSKIRSLLGTAQDQLDSIRHQIRHLGGSSELGDALSTRLQQAMESQNKFLATLSNILKKMEDSEREVVKNLK